MVCGWLATVTPATAATTVTPALILLRHPSSPVGPRDEPFGFQRGAEREPDGFALSIALEVIAVTGRGAIHSILGKG